MRDDEFRHKKYQNSESSEPWLFILLYNQNNIVSAERSFSEPIQAHSRPSDSVTQRTIAGEFLPADHMPLPAYHLPNLLSRRVQGAQDPFLRKSHLDHFLKFFAYWLQICSPCDGINVMPRYIRGHMTSGCSTFCK